METLKHLFEVIVFYIAFIIATLNPYIFLIVWCCLIVSAKYILSKEERGASDFLRSIFIGVPIGVLAGMVAMEDGYGKFMSAAIGCLVSVLAEQVLNGDLPRKIFDAFLSKIK